MHVRRSPRHAFRYPVWMVYLDLDADANGSPGLAATRRGLLAADVVRSEVRARGVGEDVRVFALTQPRSLAGSFNPVRFYFCWSGVRLAAAVLEVTSTPWRERRNYVLVPDAGVGSTYRFGFDKDLHVSPFLPMDGRYAMRVVFGAGALRIHIGFEPRRPSERGRASAWPMAAGLGLRLAPLTSREILIGALRHPVQSGMTLVRIYREALALRRRGARFHPHPRAAHAARNAGAENAPASTGVPPGGRR